jgi:diphthamide biosynthesis protein 2
MLTEPSAFSTSDESAITRTVNVKADTTADRLSIEEFDKFYDIQRTADGIIEGDYKRVRFHLDVGVLIFIIIFI